MILFGLGCAFVFSLGGCPKLIYCFDSACQAVRQLVDTLQSHNMLYSVWHMVALFDEPL